MSLQWLSCLLISAGATSLVRGLLLGSGEGVINDNFGVDLRQHDLLLMLSVPLAWVEGYCRGVVQCFLALPI